MEGVGDSRACPRKARSGGIGQGVRQDARGVVRRHAQARRSRPRALARSAHPSGRRAERRADPITADEIDSLLLDLKQGGGVTLVVVTHNIPSARTISSSLLSRSATVPSARTRPSCSTTSAIAELRALGMLCVTTTSVAPPSCLRSSSRLSISSAVIGSSPALGSSTSRIARIERHARAPDRRACACRPTAPPASCRTPRSRPTAASFCCARAPNLRVGQPVWRRIGKRDVLADRDRVEQRRVLEQKARSACRTSAELRPVSALMSRPSTNTWPLSGRTRPTM